MSVQTAAVGSVNTEPRPPKPSWEAYYLALAHIISSRSGCLGAPVGAIIVRNNRILTTGYNGTPEGWPNCDDESGCPRCFVREFDTPEKRDAARGKGVKIPSEAEFLTEEDVRDGKNLDLCVCVHAEANAVITAARFGISLEGSEAFVSDMPCMQCAKELLQVGITRVTYSRHFKVADDNSRIGQLVLGTQHQLMRDLRSRKYRLQNVAEELGTWLIWLRDSADNRYRLSLPRPRTPLDDDQYSDPGRLAYAKTVQDMRQADGQPEVTKADIRKWAKGLGFPLGPRQKIPTEIERLFWLDRGIDSRKVHAWDD